MSDNLNKWLERRKQQEATMQKVLIALSIVGGIMIIIFSII